MPAGLGGPADDPDGPLDAARPEVPWLEPFPDALLGAESTDPATIVAFENADVTALMRLLRADAVCEIPPMPTWFAGREQIGRFLAARVLHEPGDYRLIPTAANGQSAFAGLRDRDGLYRAHVVQVLTCTTAGVARIVAFTDPGHFAAFGLPPELPARLR